MNLYFTRMLPGLADSVSGPVVMNGNETCHVFCSRLVRSNAAVVELMAPALVCLGSYQILHVERPPTLIMMGQHQQKHAANTSYWYCWTKIDWH